MARLARHLKPLDFLLIAAGITLFIFAAVRTWGTNEPAGRVTIEGSGSAFLSNLPARETYSVEGPLGVTVVQIDGDRVRVLSSPCRDQICVNAGWLTLDGQWTACLPNAVFVQLLSGEGDGPDLFSY